LAVCLTLMGCGLSPSGVRDVAHQGGRGPIEIQEVPYFPQALHQCGPAALATVLAQAGKQVEPAVLAEQVYLPGRKGSLQVELLGATRRQGLLPYPVPTGFDALAEELRSGRPILVLLDLGIPIYPIWHYAVVVGHDPQARSVILRSGSTRRKILSQERFLAAWGRSGSWGFVVLRPGELPARPERARYLEAVAALEAAGQHGPAESAYRAALGFWPGDSTALLGIGNSLYGQGNLEGAARAYRRLLDAHPDSSAAYNNLAQALAEQGLREQALSTLAMGLSVTPKDHPLRATLEASQAEIRGATR
jgi:hypothetical protein